MVANIIIGLIAFVVMFIAFFLSNNYKLNKKGKKKKYIMEVKYLTSKYDIKESKLLNKTFIIFTSLVNSFIVTSVFLLIELLSWPITFKLMLAFVLVLGLIYSIYGILGSILEKKGK